MGVIGLPEIQRPFAWKNANVRDLFDSMYRGYPIGYLLLWQNADADGSKTIGVEISAQSPAINWPHRYTDAEWPTIRY